MARLCSWTAATSSSRAAIRTATGATSTVVAQPACHSTIRHRDSRISMAVPEDSTSELMTNVNETPLALALSLPRDGGFGQIPDDVWFFRQYGRFPSASRTLGIRGIQQPSCCGVGGHRPVLPQPHREGSGVGGGVLWNAGFPEYASERGYTGEYQRGPRRSRGPGHRRVPARGERAGEHPFLHQCGRTRTEDGKSRRHARVGAPIARGSDRCDCKCCRKAP